MQHNTLGHGTPRNLHPYIYFNSLGCNANIYLRLFQLRKVKSVKYATYTGNNEFKTFTYIKTATVSIATAKQKQFYVFELVPNMQRASHAETLVEYS